jgi:hypothetical protein
MPDDGDTGAEGPQNPATEERADHSDDDVLGEPMTLDI